MEKFRRRISILILLGVLISLVPMSRSYAADEAGPRVEKIVMDKSKKGNGYIKNYFLIKDFSEGESAFSDFKLDVKNLNKDNYKEIKAIRFKDKYSGRQAVVEMVNRTYEEITEGQESNEVDKEIFRKGFIALSETSEGLEIRGRMGSQAKKVLSYGYDFEPYDNSRTAAGDYEIFVDYKDSRIKSEKLNLEIVDGDDSKLYDQIFLRNNPRVINSNPRDGERYVNYNNFYNRFTYYIDGKKVVEKGYYLELDYEDFNKELALIEEDIKGNQIVIRALGENKSNQASRDRRIQFDPSRSRVYIPLEDKLDEKLEYELIVREASIIENPIFFTGQTSSNDEEDSDDKIKPEGLGNKAYKIRFTTSYRVIPDKVFEASVVEDYDEFYPILIEAKNLTYFTEVYFRDEFGRDHEAERVIRSYRDGKEFLLVYLPRYRKLLPGDYTIVFRNKRDFQSELEFGEFSVIKKGQERFEDASYINEKGKIILKSSSLENKESLDLSESSKRRIDLDSLTGSDTWTWEIVDNKNKNLLLESKDFQLDFTGLNSGNFQVGLGSPVVRDQVLRDLKGRVVLSDTLEVYGEDLEFTNLKIEMSYKSGGDIKVLRYDEFDREFKEIKNYRNSELDGRVAFESDKAGIFVIIR